jgi:hypothetical protein
VLTVGLNASMRFMMIARLTRFPNFAVAQFPYSGSSRPFITGHLASLEVSLHRGDWCLRVGKAPHQDSLTCSDRGWAVSRSRGDLRVSPAYVGYPDLYGTEGLPEHQILTASRE